MTNRTEINTEILSNQTQINAAVSQDRVSSNTVINSAVFYGETIPIGTVLCGKYRVVDKLNLESGEASLFICECESKQYVAKLYHRDVAIKDDVIAALKRINSPYVAKLYGKMLTTMHNSIVTASILSNLRDYPKIIKIILVS